MKRIGSTAIATWAILAAMQGSWAGEVPRAVRPVRNIVIMISDGCGYRHVEAASLFEHGRPGSQVYERFPVRLGVSTFSNGGSYDSGKAWTDFEYVKGGCTDSAAAATAMACGKKTYNGAIGVGPDKKPLKNVLERAEELGMSTGVVTSVQFAHATPAGFVAHNVNRGNYARIGEEMIQRSAVDVIMGCGHPLFDDNGKPARNPDYRFVGGEETWQALTAGTAGGMVDADHNGALDDTWSMVSTRDEFRALREGPAPKRLIGIPQVRSTLQQRRSGHDDNIRDDEPYETPLTQTVPTLAEMTAGALNVLDDDPDGFCLMIEGGAVDWAGHGNQSGRLIEEQSDFNRAVETVVQWVESHSNWHETLLIVTADHETGYLTRRAMSEGQVPWAFEPLLNNGKGKLPGMSWHSGGHTNSLVPLYAKGAGADRLAAAAVGTDRHHGKYVDNTAIAKLVFELLGE